MRACVCVGVNVLYHVVKCTSYRGSQSKRFEKCQTEFPVSLLCAGLTVPSPPPPAPSPPPLHSSLLHPPKAYSFIHTVVAGFSQKKTLRRGCFLGDDPKKHHSKETGKRNRKGTGATWSVLRRAPAAAPGLSLLGTLGLRELGYSCTPSCGH